MFTGEKYNSYQNGIKVIDQKIDIQNVENIKFQIISTDNLFALDNKLLFNFCKDRQLLVFVSQNVAGYYMAQIKPYFSTYFPASHFHIKIIATTEHNKNLTTIEEMCAFAQQKNLNRKGLMLAIGGGILNDMTGFAASMYKRGIDYIRICTTLIGQIDVSVGIKVGINFNQSKNLIGAFYPPLASINDKNFLQTLDLRDIRCGLAEIIKMAIICDYQLFELVEKEQQTILNRCFNGQNINKILARSQLRMLEELYPNFYETDLERIVDFGHTFSPLLESVSQYKIKHGEAVAIDMALSCRIAVLMGLLKERDYQRIINLLLNIGLPITCPQAWELDLIKKALHETYLHRGKKINLVVPRRIGQAIFIREKNELKDQILQTALHDLAQTAYSGQGRAHLKSQKID